MNNVHVRRCVLLSGCQCMSRAEARSMVCLGLGPALCRYAQATTHAPTPLCKGKGVDCCISGHKLVPQKKGRERGGPGGGRHRAVE